MTLHYRNSSYSDKKQNTIGSLQVDLENHTISGHIHKPVTHVEEVEFDSRKETGHPVQVATVTERQ